MNVPAAFRRVLLNAFQKVVFESCFSLLQVGFLLLVFLHVTEVHVGSQLLGGIAGETSKGRSAGKLVLRRQTEGANWADLAVVLDCHDHGGEAVELGQALFRDLDFFLLTLI